MENVETPSSDMETEHVEMQSSSYIKTEHVEMQLSSENIPVEMAVPSQSDEHVETEPSLEEPSVENSKNY